MAKPIYDPFSWNAPDNSLQALYEYYLEGGDEDAGGGGTGGGGGITNAYYPQSTGGDNLQYNEMPVLSAEDYGLDSNAMQLGYQPVDNQYYLDDIGEGTIARDDLTLAESIVGDRGLKTIRKSDDDEVPPGWLTEQYNKLPGYVKQYALPTTIGAMNPIMGGALALSKFMRPDATESAVGIGGLYASEANLAEDLLQAGLLVDAGNKGMKTITGKNFVSLMGGYEEGQQEIYDKFIKDYGGTDPETQDDAVEEWFQDTYSKKVSGDVTKSFKYKQWKESKFNRNRKEVMTANTIANMKSYTPPVRHPTDGDGPVITPASTGTMIGQGPLHGVTPAAPKATMIGQGPLHGVDRPSGDNQSRGSSYSRPGSGGAPGHHWAKGGRVRYGNGGIVDLL